MGRRANIPEVPLGISTEIIEGVEEIQVHAKGERPTVLLSLQETGLCVCQRIHPLTEGIY